MKALIRRLLALVRDRAAGGIAWEAETPTPDLVAYGIAMSLDARKAERIAKMPARSKAAHKGWRTRRGM